MASQKIKYFLSVLISCFVTSCYKTTHSYAPVSKNVDTVNSSPDTVAAIIPHGVMYVKNSFMYDSLGNQFLMKGMNFPVYWYMNTYKSSMAAASSLGCNTARIVWQTDQLIGGMFVNKLDSVLNTAIKLKMIPVLEMHDNTGSNDTDTLLNSARYYVRNDVKAVLQKYAPYVIINIANEWGDYSLSSSDYVSSYIKAVKIIRDGGLQNLLMIDASDWGKNISVIANNGRKILETDPYRNICFSAHAYSASNYWKLNADYNSHLNSVISKNLCLVIGEFGWDALSTYYDPQQLCNVDAPRLMQTCHDNNVGYIAWSWYGNDAANKVLDICNSWSDTTKLTEWGKIWAYHPYGVQAKAVRCSYFAD